MSINFLKEKISKPRLTESFLDDLDAAGIEIAEPDDNSLVPVNFTLDIYVGHSPFDPGTTAKEKKAIHDAFVQKWPKVVNTIRTFVENSPLFEDDDEEPKFDISILYLQKELRAGNTSLTTTKQAYDKDIEDADDKFNMIVNEKYFYIEITGDTLMFYKRADRNYARALEYVVRTIANTFTWLGLKDMTYSFDLIYNPDKDALQYVPYDHQASQAFFVPVHKLDNIKINYQSDFNYSYDYKTKRMEKLDKPEIINIPVNNDEVLHTDLFDYAFQITDKQQHKLNRFKAVLYRVTNNSITVDNHRLGYQMDVTVTLKNLANSTINPLFYQNNRTHNAIKRALQEATDMINNNPDDMKYKCIFIQSETGNPDNRYVKKQDKAVVVYLTNVFIKVEDILFCFGLSDMYKATMKVDKNNTDGKSKPDPKTLQKQAENYAVMASFNTRYTGNTELAEILSDKFDIPLNKLIDDNIVNRTNGV